MFHIAGMHQVHKGMKKLGKRNNSTRESIVVFCGLRFDITILRSQYLLQMPWLRFTPCYWERGSSNHAFYISIGSTFVISFLDHRCDHWSLNNDLAKYPPKWSTAIRHFDKWSALLRKCKYYYLKEGMQKRWDYFKEWSKNKDSISN